MDRPLVEIMVRYFYENEELMTTEMSRAIESVNKQTYDRIVVTFCRDGGLNASDLITGQCARQMRFLGCGTNMGRGWATNALLAASIGDYFMLLDSDDYIEPGFVDKCVTVARDGVVMIKPQVKLVYLNAPRESVGLLDLYFSHLMREGDEAYRKIFGDRSIKVFPSGLQMISNMFHGCLASLRTRADLNITEDNYWMHKANRIVRGLGFRQATFVPQAGEFYVQVHVLNRMARYERLGLKMKAEDYYEMPTEGDIEGVENGFAQRARKNSGDRTAP